MTPEGTSSAAGAILVVEDDRVNRLLLTRSLEADGHSVATARDGLAALELLETDQLPDVVLLDIVMPGLDGFAVLEHIKADARLRDLPVIMISAVDEMESVVRCIEAGAEDYLPKPFDPILLRARINSGLTRRRLTRIEQERLRDMFARFLPEAVVDEVLRDGGGEPRLGGVRRVGTVLFGDLRGFTAFAEQTSPDVVVDVLNQFFEQMSDAILDGGGTLLGFLGDGILAVFGAPIVSDDHADRALSAAREMLHERLPRFNAWARASLADGSTEFRMGIGIASGPFMSGNVGSTRRVEYTAIGDTVNLAARLEELTKELDTPVLVAGSTRELSLNGNRLEFVTEHRLRGRKEPIQVWTLDAGAG